VVTKRCAAARDPGGGTGSSRGCRRFRLIDDWARQDALIEVVRITRELPNGDYERDVLPPSGDGDFSYFGRNQLF